VDLRLKADRFTRLSLLGNGVAWVGHLFWFTFFAAWSSPFPTPKLPLALSNSSWLFQLTRTALDLDVSEKNKKSDSDDIVFSAHLL
jgi:hypothetical protein